MNSCSQNRTPTIITTERIFIHNVDPSVNPCILYVDYEGSSRLEVSRSSPGKGLNFIGLSGGRACYHDNKNHNFVIWNVTNQIVEASVQERPGLHRGERGCFGFSYTRRGDAFFIVRLQIPLLQIRKEDPKHASTKRWIDSYRSDTNIWTRRTINCEGPLCPLADPGLAAQGFILWKASIFKRAIIIEYDFENYKLRNLNLPKPAQGKLDFTSLRLGFGYRGEVVASSYMAPTRREPEGSGRLMLWLLNKDRENWEHLPDVKVKFKPRHGSRSFLPLVFFKGTNEDYRFFHNEFDILRFKSKGDGIWQYQKIHSTLQCKALGFGPRPYEEKDEECQTQAHEVEKKGDGSQLQSSRNVVMALPKAKELVLSNSVVIFSKSYCPFCVTVKQLFSRLGANFKAIELDQESDGSQLQSALAEWTGQQTVPNVFIGGNHIGGCDTTMALHKEGNLVPLLTEAGSVAKSSA